MRLVALFLLFTSYRQLEAVYELLAPRLERANRFVLRQGSHIARKQMIDVFKSVGNAVLFGTATFWEGVDIRGEALQRSSLLNYRLKCQTIRSSMPDIRRLNSAAVIHLWNERFLKPFLRLKQGVGRLIRTVKTPAPWLFATIAS